MIKNLCNIYLEAAISKKQKQDPFLSLSPREKELLDYVVHGRTNKEIAKLLKISDNTVRNHIASIMTKLKVGNRTEAAFLWHSREKKNANPDSHDDKDEYWKDWKRESVSTSHPLESKYGRIGDA